MVSEFPAKRISPYPEMSQHHFSGTPSYEGTPTFQQLESEIRNHAYFLWKRYGWDETYCWLVAERVLFFGLEEHTFDTVGYRVYVRGEGPDANGCEWKVKIITPKFPMVFLNYGKKEPDRNLIFKAVPEPASKDLCQPLTLCKAINKCPDKV